MNIFVFLSVVGLSASAPTQPPVASGAPAGPHAPVVTYAHAPVVTYAAAPAVKLGVAPAATTPLIYNYGLGYPWGLPLVPAAAPPPAVRRRTLRRLPLWPRRLPHHRPR